MQERARTVVLESDLIAAAVRSPSCSMKPGGIYGRLSDASLVVILVLKVLNLYLLSRVSAPTRERDVQAVGK
jgi:hypothetical protein